MKLLIIEDNQIVASRIKAHFSRQHTVDVVGMGREALDKVDTTNYGIIILDLNLPDMSGLEVCRQLRLNGITAPLLVLTGVDGVRSRVELLEAGADDYLTKPFNSAELKARVKALARRRAKPYNASSVIVVKDLTLDSARRQVIRAGTKIPLRRKEFDILEYLVENRGRAVSREMIMNHVWESGKESWNNTVDVHIKHLRDKIDKPYPAALIKTAYGIGYMVDDGL